MPRSHKENERIRKSTKENILKSGMELFIAQGYHTTTISRIAEQAGISKGLLYNYFKGKEKLLETIVDRRIEAISEVMNQAVSKKTPAEQLKYIISEAIDNVYKKPEEYRFYLHLQTQPEADEELVKYSRNLVSENARLFELQCEIFETQGVDEARKRSLYFSSTLQGIMLMISTYPQQFPVEEIKQQIIDEFCVS